MPQAVATQDSLDALSSRLLEVVQCAPQLGVRQMRLRTLGGTHTGQSPAAYPTHTSPRPLTCGGGSIHPSEQSAALTQTLTVRTTLTQLATCDAARALLLRVAEAQHMRHGRPLRVRCQPDSSSSSSYQSDAVWQPAASTIRVNCHNAQPTKVGSLLFELLNANVRLPISPPFSYYNLLSKHWNLSSCKKASTCTERQ